MSARYSLLGPGAQAALAPQVGQPSGICGWDRAALWFPLLPPNCSFFHPRMFLVTWFPMPVLHVPRFCRCGDLKSTRQMWVLATRFLETELHGAEAICDAPSHCFTRTVLTSVENLFSLVLFIASPTSYAHGNFFF